MTDPSTETKATPIPLRGGEIEPRDPAPETLPSSRVSLDRTASTLTPEIAFWSYVRERTSRLRFEAYQKVIDEVMCATPRGGAQAGSSVRSPFPGVDRYTLLKTSTEVFLMAECGVASPLDGQDTFARKLDSPLFSGNDAARLESERSRVAPNPVTAAQLNDLWKAHILPTGDPGGIETLPYLKLIRSKLKEIPLSGEDQNTASNCFGILESKLTSPCMIELIWSYWHEEAMLVQTLNAISMRFQNRRRHTGRDPLAHLEIDPLRPLNSILWGYVQDEQHRLSVERRAYEYDHHYGITLQGRAIPALKASDSRSKFLQAFHNLLHTCSVFYKQDDDTTIVSDAFPVLNSLKETHLILTQGAHGQYGDLPWTARMEMLMEEWILARPEIREFLPSRVMVAFPEEWMDRVEAMKKFQGWDDTPVLHFRDLGVFGEQVLLTVRFGLWTNIIDPVVAKNWVRYWRPEIQGYLHAYRAVTGVDLNRDQTDAVMPSIHLKRRLEEQLRKTLGGQGLARSRVSG